MDRDTKQNTMKLEPKTITLSKLELKWLIKDYERCMATADPDENIYIHIKQINKNK